jgi:plasmid stabilization system protein ParE
MPDYRLSPKATADLEDIYAQDLEQFGPAQADRYQYELHGRFQLLAEFPGIAGRSLKGLSPASSRPACIGSACSAADSADCGSKQF